MANYLMYTKTPPNLILTTKYKPLALLLMTSTLFLAITNVLQAVNKKNTFASKRWLILVLLLLAIILILTAIA